MNGKWEGKMVVRIQGSFKFKINLVFAGKLDKFNKT